VANIAGGVGNFLQNFARGVGLPAARQQAAIDQIHSNIRAQESTARLQSLQTALKVFEVQEAKKMQAARQNYKRFEGKVKDTFLPIMKNVFKEQQAEATAAGEDPPKDFNQQTFRISLQRHEEMHGGTPAAFTDMDRLTMTRSERGKALMLQHNILPYDDYSKVLQKEAEQNNAARLAIAKEAAFLPGPGQGLSPQAGGCGSIITVCGNTTEQYYNATRWNESDERFTCQNTVGGNRATPTRRIAV
jgi:hypothetical protein